VENLYNPHDVDNEYKWSITTLDPARNGTVFTDFLVRLNGEVAGTLSLRSNSAATVTGACPPVQSCRPFCIVALAFRASTPFSAQRVRRLTSTGRLSLQYSIRDKRVSTASFLAWRATETEILMTHSRVQCAAAGNLNIGLFVNLID
jgi:hypothetical protein